ncbi:MYXO-CTERM sorting domain-containing protein [Streptomyces sp. NPDC059534]
MTDADPSNDTAPVKLEITGGAALLASAGALLVVRRRRTA